MPRQNQRTLEDPDRISGLMSKTVRTVDSKESLLASMKIMVKHDIGSVVVLKGGKPFGIITERDIIKRLGRDGPSSLTRASGVIASRPLVSVGPDFKTWEAFAIMLKKGIRRLPVISNGKLAGIVTERDLLKWVVMVTYEPNIPDEVRRLIKQNP
jgi:CBS domain-containing protein